MCRPIIPGFGIEMSLKCLASRSKRSVQFLLIYTKTGLLQQHACMEPYLVRSTSCEASMSRPLGVRPSRSTLQASRHLRSCRLNQLGFIPAGLKSRFGTERVVGGASAFPPVYKDVHHMSEERT